MAGKHAFRCCIRMYGSFQHERRLLTTNKVVHLIFSFSSVLSWMLFVVDLGLIGFLSLHAYQDGEYLIFDRFCNVAKPVPS